MEFVSFYTYVRECGGARSSVVVEELCYKQKVAGLKPNEANNFISIYINLQPLTEMSFKSGKVMFLGSRARPVHRADNPISRLPKQCGILNISQPYRHPRPVSG
jgi:hypothetical protein